MYLKFFKRILAMTTQPELPANILDFTQRKRMALINALLPDDQIATQDPKITNVGVKVLKDMDSTEIGIKRLQLDDKIAGDNATIARDLIQATYNNIANGIAPYINPNPDPNAKQSFDMPDDILPGFEPGEGIVGVGVTDRTYDEIMQADPNAKQKDGK